MVTDARQIRILTVDDHALLREGIAALVEDEPDMKLIAEATNGKEAIEKFRLHHPNVTLMDLRNGLCVWTFKRAMRRSAVSQRKVPCASGRLFTLTVRPGTRSCSGSGSALLRWGGAILSFWP
jgi:hypothetical protein